MAEGVEFLLKRYPDYVAVDDLPLDTVQERVIHLSLLDDTVIMSQRSYVTSVKPRPSRRLSQ